MEKKTETNKTSNAENCSKSWFCCGKLGVIVNILTFLLLAYLSYFVISNEYWKVWWKANFNKLKSVYSLSGYVNGRTTNITDMEKQVNWWTVAPQGDTPTQGDTQQPQQPAQPQQQFPTSKLTADQAKKVKDGYAVNGAADAKVTIIEYTDPECPFCVRHHNDKTLENTMAAFPGKVNVITKPVQWVNHTNTQYKSLAIICAGTVWDGSKYYSMFDKIEWSSTQSAMVPNDKIPEFAKELWLDAAKFDECMNSQAAKDIYNANWAEAQGFGANGTPGNLIINNETNETTLIAGAYPLDQFKSIIEPMVK